MMSRPKTLIAGVGSPHGDDRAGWAVIDRLAAHSHNGFVELRRARSPVDLLDWLDGAGRLIVCDGCRGLAQVGDARRWTWPSGEIEQAAWSGSHDLPLPAVLQLADRLDRLPTSVVVWAIEVGDIEKTAAISPAVAAAASHIADAIFNAEWTPPATRSLRARRR